MNHTLKVMLALFAFAGVFLSGGIVGGVVTARLAREKFERFQQDTAQRERDSAQATQKLVEQMQKQETEAIERAKAPPRPRFLPRPEQFGAQLMRRFSEQLDLTADQRAKVRPMVDAAAENLRRLRRDTAHTAEIQIEQLEDQIAAVLTPDQRARFTELIQTQREQLQKFFRDQQARQARPRDQAVP